MSEFENLKNDAEQYAKDHPQQVHAAEQAAERKLGLGGQGQQAQDQQGQGQQAQDQYGQGQQAQDQYGQGQQGQDQ